MSLTQRDIDLLRDVHRYKMMTRAQGQALRFGPGQTQGRVCRARFECLSEKLGYLGYTQLKFGTLVLRVYHLSTKGRDFLADYTGDETIRAADTRPPEPGKLFHWLAITDVHILFDRAIAAQADNRLTWVTEWDVVNPAESDPAKRFFLYEVLSEQPRVIFAPDFGLNLSNSRGHAKVLYGEVDRHSESAPRYIASKVKGVAEAARQRTHRKHFPATTLEKFTVLMFSPDEQRREALRTALKKQAPEGANLWRFCSLEKLTPDRLLFDKIFYPFEGEPGSLLVGPATANPGEEVA